MQDVERIPPDHDPVGLHWVPRSWQIDDVGHRIRVNRIICLAYHYTFVNFDISVWSDLSRAYKPPDASNSL